ncbi:glutaminyl-peptide cyclotransferase [bacterium]|nr:MAG: glutaminyl-peptide cyclotransferase [bacterium]
MPASTQKAGAPELKWEVLGSFPHATDAFTEGLLVHNGKLYESTGLEGQSSVRRIDLQSGTVEKKVDLPKQLFGEGLALAGGKFYQLTWQNKLGVVYDENFKAIGKFSFQNEGWGLTYDGKSLIQSDGTDTLTWRDPKDFAAEKTVKVTWNGESQNNINELEWINGKIWANIWQQDDILIINPATGKVESYLDLSTILSEAERGGSENVLNGIAYDQKNERLFVTGKNWPKLFWIRVKQ